MILSHPEFSARTQHPAADLAAYLALADDHVREMGPYPGVRNQIAHCEVLGPANDSLGPVVIHANIDKGEVVSVRVGPYRHDLRGEYACNRAFRSVHRFNLRAREIEQPH
jgi:hypothetical protein